MPFLLTPITFAWSCDTGRLLVTRNIFVFAFTLGLHDMSHSHSQDTPTKSQTAPNNPDYHGTSVEGSHDALFQDAHEIAEVTLQTLLSAVIPAEMDTNADILYQALIENRAVNNLSGWTCMTTKSASSNEKGGKMFEPLKRIYNQVRLAAKIKQPSLMYTPNGSKTLDSDQTDSSQPDAYLQLWESLFTKRD